MEDIFPLSDLFYFSFSINFYFIREMVTVKGQINERNEKDAFDLKYYHCYLAFISLNG